MKNSLSFLSCIGTRIKEGCVTVEAKQRQPTAVKTGKGQFLRGNRRNLARDGVARKSSSPQRVASVSNLCNSRSQGAGNTGNGERRFVPSKQVRLPTSGKSSAIEDPLETQSHTGGDGV